VGVAGGPGACYARGGEGFVDGFKDYFRAGEAFDELSAGAWGIGEEGDGGALLFGGATAEGAVAAVVGGATGVLGDDLVAVAQFAGAFG